MNGTLGISRDVRITSRIINSIPRRARPFTRVPAGVVLRVRRALAARCGVVGGSGGQGSSFGGKVV